jgi:hypothetical protein
MHRNSDPPPPHPVTYLDTRSHVHHTPPYSTLYMYMHTYIYIYIYAYTNTHIYIYKHNPDPKPNLIYLHTSCVQVNRFLLTEGDRRVEYQYMNLDRQYIDISC